MDFDKAIKAALEKQVKALGGVESAAHLVGMGKTQLANYYHPDRSERLPLIVAMRLDEVAGEPAILTVAAGLLGYRLERIDGTAEGDIAAALGATASVAGQLISEGILAGLDRKYTPAERRQLAHRVAALQGELAALTQALGTEGQSVGGEG